jgi:dTDP-4-dehydrorhamnose reductase
LNESSLLSIFEVMTSILILGKNGQVGDALVKAFVSEAQCHAFDSHDADLTNEKQLRQLIQHIKPSVIINAAAFTAVDQAEGDEVLAYKVNARGPQIIGEEATIVGASVIHFSTDYVFDGTKKTPYKETDKTNPLNVYGASKLQGEKLLMKACCQSIILRTSWVVSDHGQNFLKTMLRLAHDREVLRVVSDQRGVPTSAYLLADVSRMLVNKLNTDDKKNFPYGIYHVVPRGQTNWYEYAKLVIHEAMKLGDTFSVSPEMMHAIQTKDYPTQAKRPLNSRLDTSLFEKQFSMTLPPWEEGVFAIIRALYKG